MLIEFLYECSDRDTLAYLLDALSIVKEKLSRRRLSKDPNEEEVEQILNLSGAIKHNITGDKLDEDFAYAYVEESEESDNKVFLWGEGGDEGGEEWMHRVETQLNDFNDAIKNSRDSDKANFRLSASSGVATCKKFL
uniref:Uncharacterized protein n=1 Tax=Opuntia streptacantha TaxID=393608 RepID=A0A7C9ES21_OPUST